ncbi:FkbM family methyltransferase [Patescibacteria group bacterium]|nr:FkbM family methyltransferase [Patescibacteria group bacterium]
MSIQHRVQHFLDTPIGQIPKKLLATFFPNWLRDPFQKLKRLPRFTTGETVLFSKKITIADGPSFVSMYKELFEHEIYKFSSNTDHPVIIDCGANIGLSVIYFKRLFPEAKITCFEPDPRIFKILQSNIAAFGLREIHAEQKAVFNKEIDLQFYAQGGDGGRLANSSENNKTIIVSAVRLREYLHEKIDFLKIDIEGAEAEVIEDCADLLANVDNLFVEFHSFDGQEQHLDTILRAIHNAGMRYYIHPIGIQSAHPFYEKKTYEGSDMQLNIFACRK